MAGAVPLLQGAPSHPGRNCATDVHWPRAVGVYRDAKALFICALFIYPLSKYLLSDWLWPDPVLGTLGDTGNGAPRPLPPMAERRWE